MAVSVAVSNPPRKKATCKQDVVPVKFFAAAEVFPVLSNLEKFSKKFCRKRGILQIMSNGIISTHETERERCVLTVRWRVNHGFKKHSPEIIWKQH